MLAEQTEEMHDQEYSVMTIRALCSISNVIKAFQKDITKNQTSVVSFL